MKDDRYWLWFMGIKNISLKQKNALLNKFDTPENIYYMTNETIIQTKILTLENINTLRSDDGLIFSKKTQHTMEKYQIEFISKENKWYPNSLKELYMPPIGLYIKGLKELLKKQPMIGIVGSRNPTILAKKYARGFANELVSFGITIVSGLASGIDSESHWGSINAAGNTIGVLGTGIDQCYPKSNQKLFDLMTTQGLIISEFNLEEKPLPYHFPQRNRIISGLSDGVLIIQARRKSGSLITGNYALEQGKNIYVIPGDISSTQWSGSNQLIKEGAKLVSEPNDILEDFIIVNEMNRSNKKYVPEIREVEINDPDEKIIYDLIKKGYTTIDECTFASGLAINQVNIILTMLELENVIKVKYGKIILV
jgi:DNA processing protein